jgi:hypothetical protein
MQLNKTKTRLKRRVQNCNGHLNTGASKPDLQVHSHTILPHPQLCSTDHTPGAREYKAPQSRQPFQPASSTKRRRSSPSPSWSHVVAWASLSPTGSGSRKLLFCRTRCASSRSRHRPRPPALRDVPHNKTPR